MHNVGLFMHLQLLGLLPLNTSILVVLQTWVSLAGGTAQKVCFKFFPSLSVIHILSLSSLSFIMNVDCEYRCTYICTVYRSLGYIEVVAAAAEDSMKMAVNEMADYVQKGEVYFNVQCVYLYSYTYSFFVVGYY